MKHNPIKRFTALAIALCLLLGMLPLSASAAAAVTVDVANSSIYANGNAITVQMRPGDATGERVQIVLDDHPSTPVELPGVDKDSSGGYDLSHYIIYGGSKDAPVNGDTSITMTGGKVSSIYGGGRADSGSSDATVNGSTVVTITGGSVKNSVHGGGDAQKTGDTANVTGNATVTITNDAVDGGSRLEVYGGGFASLGTANVAGKATVNIHGGTVQDISGCGFANTNMGSTAVAQVGGSEVVITNGTIRAVYAVNRGANNALAGGTHAAVNISGGTVESVSDSNGSGSDTLAISGSAVIGNATSGVNLAKPFKSVSIDSGFTGSVKFNVPSGYDASSQPTVAAYVENGDMNKLSLNGDGAAGKELYLDAADVKVRNISVPHTHSIDGKEVVFTALDPNEPTIADGGYYYLTDDCADLFVYGKAATLCLNGHTVSAETENTAPITVLSDLALVDCSEEKTGKVTAFGDGPCLFVEGNRDDSGNWIYPSVDVTGYDKALSLLVMDFQAGLPILKGVADTTKYTLLSAGHFLKADTENNQILYAAYEITQQPTTADPTVEVIPADSVRSYAWGDFQTSEVASGGGITPLGTYNAATKQWTAQNDGWGTYFKLDMQAGDQLIVTFAEGQTMGDHGLLMLVGEDSRNEVDTPEENGTYVLTAPASGNYTLAVDAAESPVLSAVNRYFVGAALPDGNTNTLTASGTYVCRITWADGTVLFSNSVHVHSIRQTSSGIAPTCTSSGRKGYYRCDLCGLHFEDSLGKTEIGDDEALAGWLAGSGSEIPATGHSWNTVWAHNNTHHWHECQNADCPLTENSDKDGYAGHSYGEWTTTREPTATETGEKEHSCTCGYKETEEIPATGQTHTHTWGDWSITKAPTMTDTGTAEHTCTADNHKETETLPVLTDTSVWREGERVEPTPSAPGSQTYTSIYGNVTVEIPIPTYAISGQVNEPDGGNTKPVKGAVVKLMRGNTEVCQSITTDASGEYSFTGVEIGSYNVVAEKDGKTMTILVKLTDGNETNQNLTMPSKNVSSVLQVEDTVANTAAKVDEIVVGGLDAEAAANAEADSTVTVTMTVKSKTEAQVEEAQEIKTKAGNNTTLEYMEIKVEKKLEVAGSTEPEIQPITTTNDLLEIVIPFDFTDKERDSVKVYRYHEENDSGSVDVLTTTPSDGEWITLNSDSISLHVKKFSTYAIGYTRTGDRPTRPTTPTPTPAPTRPSWNPFTDVAETDWFHGSVKYVYENELMVGTSDTKFGPQLDASRGMIVTILWRLEGEPEPKTASSFPDVAEDKYYTKAIAWAAENHIVAGYGSGKYGPNDSITRQQLAAILWRYAGSPESAGNLDKFTDGNKAGNYAVPALRWAVEQGILSGRGNGILDPRGKANRAEIAAMLMRFCEKAK